MSTDHPPRLDRRRLLASAVTLCGPMGAMATASPSASLAALEQASGGRLGVQVLDTGTGATFGHRTDERFGMCSTFKLPLAAVVLREVDQGRLRDDQWVPYGPADLLGHAPVTRERVAQGGMTLAALAHAIQTTSDNTAANLLLGLLGGPAGFTARLREGGDTVTRLDRLEPEMNRVVAGDPRDTTTPAAMAATVARQLTGDALSAASRARLVAWMVETRTGLRRVRAGLPPAWQAGDKTGTAMAPGMADKVNDVAIAWPPGRAPIVVAAFHETARSGSADLRPQDEAVLASVGRLAAGWVTGKAP